MTCRAAMFSHDDYYPKQLLSKIRGCEVESALCVPDRPTLSYTTFRVSDSVCFDRQTRRAKRGAGGEIGLLRAAGSFLTDRPSALSESM